MSLEIERIPLQGNAIACAYIDDHARVATFFDAGPPVSLASFRQRAELIRQSFSEQRWVDLVDAFGSDDAASGDRLSELIEARGFFVATGQQAGLFGGPLMAIYKALTAARLAHDLQEHLGVPVMPLFTVASEDHDWREVDHTQVVDVSNQLVRIEINRPRSDGAGGSEDGEQSPDPPVHRIRLSEDIQATIERFAEALPDSELKPEIIDRLRRIYRPGSGFADAFQQLLEQLLAGYPFLIVQMSHPYIKLVSRDLLWADWDKRAEIHSELTRRADELAAAGFSPQVTVPERTTNLFVEGSLGRDRVVWDEEGAHLRRSGERLSPEELRKLIYEAPESVSPGVLLRPVVEAGAFPVIAHVAGPAEIAYLAQSQVLYQLLGVPAPVAVPRASFRLIEPKVRKVLDKYELDPDALSGDADQAIAKLVKERKPLRLKQAVEELRTAVDAALDSVESLALDYDPGAKSALGTGRRAIIAGIETLEGKLEGRVKEKHQVMRQQLQKIAVNLYPAGKPQERLLNVHPFLARYGPDLLDRVYEACEPELIE
ncbi:MAG: bacillithiol biosynthesis cysteine-adding enzyme BshC [Gemmatimonadota bacterium]